MSVPVEKFHKVQNATAAQIFAIIVDKYGRRIANDVAKEIIENNPTPVVEWPRW